MAKFKPILGELSGKLAGSVFSHNGAGAYVRQKSTPTNQNSTRQQLVRSRMAYVSSAWQALSDTQRGVWSNWGTLNTVTDSFGNTVALTGQQAYVQLNSRVLNNGGLLFVSPPATTNVTVPASFAATVTGPNTIAIVGAATLGAAYRYEVLVTPGTGAGRNPNFRAAKWAGASALAAGANFTITSAVPFTTGQYTNIFVRVTDIYGQSNTPTRVRVQVA